MRKLTKVFPRMNIGNVNLNDGCLYGCNRIADRNGCVRIPGGIQNNTIILKPHKLQSVDQFTFNIALIVRKFDRWIFLSQLVEKLLKWHIAVYIGFPRTEKI